MFGYGDVKLPQKESVDSIYQIIEELRDKLMNSEVVSSVCGGKKLPGKIISNRMMKMMKCVFRKWWEKFELVSHLEK